MFSLKLVLLSTSVLSAAIMLRFSAPAMADFAECLPSIYNDVVSWMRPPYLYIVINCIIITIVASSRLQSGKDDDVSLSPSGTQALDVAVGADTLRPLPVKSIPAEFEPYRYNGVVLSDSSGYEVEEAEKGFEIDTCEQVVDLKVETAPFVASVADGGAAFAADATSNKENEFVTAKSTWTFLESKVLTENSPSNVKPPVSKKFGYRRNVKASPEGGVKTVLGVSKPKKQDTLESTWRTITEGRAMPVTRHLKKSDTWERNDNHLHGRHHLQENKTPPQKTMMKAETFNDRIYTRSPSPGSSDGSERLRRDASLSSDELNRRVEAFIKKFNEDMRLQRQESFNQYKEMVNA